MTLKGLNNDITNNTSLNPSFVLKKLQKRTNSSISNCQTLNEKNDIKIDINTENRPIRKWQQYQNNRFFCNGRVVMSKQSSIFFLTIFILIFTTTLFCIFE